MKCFNRVGNFYVMVPSIKNLDMTQLHDRLCLLCSSVKIMRFLCQLHKLITNPPELPPSPPSAAMKQPAGTTSKLSPTHPPAPAPNPDLSMSMLGSDIGKLLQGVQFADNDSIHSNSVNNVDKIEHCGSIQLHKFIIS